LDQQKTIRPTTNQLSSTSIRRTADIDDSSRYGIAQNMLGRTQTTATTRTTKHDIDEYKKEISELDEKYMQSKIRITRKYKGKRKSFPLHLSLNSIHRECFY
jgi:hypothetical protein